MVLAVKEGGDFTSQLGVRLLPGIKATLTGAFGLFDHRLGSGDQVWIAGGIGVTPFLSWLRSLDQPLRNAVDLYYLVRSPEDAVFADELHALAAGQPRLSVTVNVSQQEGSLTVDRISVALAGDLSDRHLFMCGPAPMVAAFERGFAANGVPYSRIHYEQFAFR